ncbi:metallophosphoesterase, partial [Pseudomonas ogarae]
MSLLHHWEHEFDKVKVRLHGLVTRLEMSWKKLVNDLEPEEFQAIVKLLQRGHDQARHVIEHGDLPDDEPAVPWELAHGLSIPKIGHAEPAPHSAAELPTRAPTDGALLGSLPLLTVLGS